mmetsp:Transcript_22935/g.48741  ORF Transcript_22935/g.48741 Transcript_22935/m.48741 type:complete len:152 (-) Transcript_22935:27-482(-)
MPRRPPNLELESEVTDLAAHAAVFGGPPSPPTTTLSRQGNAKREQLEERLAGVRREVLESARLAEETIDRALEIVRAQRRRQEAEWASLEDGQSALRQQLEEVSRLRTEISSNAAKPKGGLLGCCQAAPSVARDAEVLHERGFAETDYHRS